MVAGACSKDLKRRGALPTWATWYAHGAAGLHRRRPRHPGRRHDAPRHGLRQRSSTRVVMAHCQDDGLVAEGQVNEGVASTRLGMLGWPAEGEEIEIARDIALCRLTGCPLHIQHITTARGLDLVRRRQGRGPAGHLRGDAAPHVPHRGRHHRRVPDRAEGEPAAAHRRGRRRAHRGRGRTAPSTPSSPTTRPTPTGRRTASSSWRPSA